MLLSKGDWTNLSRNYHRQTLALRNYLWSWISMDGYVHLRYSGFGLTLCGLKDVHSSRLPELSVDSQSNATICIRCKVAFWSKVPRGWRR